jgi:hypothetical protein
VFGCDCKAETIETLLALIEKNGDEDPLLHVEGFNYDRATITLKKRTLPKLAEREPIAATIQAVGECLDPPIGEAGEEKRSENKSYAPPESFQKQFLAYSLGSYSFSVAQCANKLETILLQEQFLLEGAAPQLHFTAKTTLRQGRLLLLQSWPLHPKMWRRW